MLRWLLHALEERERGVVDRRALESRGEPLAALSLVADEADPAVGSSRLENECLGLPRGGGVHRDGEVQRLSVLSGVLVERKGEVRRGPVGLRRFKGRDDERKQ